MSSQASQRAAKTPASLPAAPSPSVPLGATEELWVWKGGKWREEVALIEDDRAKGNVRFADIALFYGNQIDYVRVAMCLLAGFTIRANWPLTSATLIFVSVLLDWIDGPVSRAYNQCTIFGSGVDWLADVLCQIITMGWWVQLDPSVLPWCVAQVLTGTSFCASVGVYSCSFLLGSMFNVPVVSFSFGESLCSNSRL